MRAVATVAPSTRGDRDSTNCPRRNRIYESTAQQQIQARMPARCPGSSRMNSTTHGVFHDCQMPTATKVRLRFAKCGDLRFVSHHDIMRCLERMLRRASIPMATSQGFNSRPKMTFALALGLGIQGTSEVVDLELSEPCDPSDLLDRLEAAAPPGFVWNDVQALSSDAPAPRPQSVEYRIKIPTDRRSEAQSALETLLSSSSWPLTRHREDRVSTYDLRPHILEAQLTNEGVLCFRLRVSPDGSARPEELLEALGLRDLLAAGAVLIRTAVELDVKGSGETRRLSTNERSAISGT